MEKRKQFEKDVNASFRNLNESLQGILKAQQKSRQELEGMPACPMSPTASPLAKDSLSTASEMCQGPLRMLLAGWLTGWVILS